ncbi:MAG: hypothetical protein K9K40_00845 [Desulfotignum sp.]|nr:hypothetical protein [Desulfotignum sp.]MCF8124691.1 hypothetical protein [Desulfotignum sp.]
MQIFRQILPHASDFKRFWKEAGPFAFALTSAEFPPVLLEPEEWIFGHTARDVLKELMGFNRKKMAFLRTGFNPDNPDILRPDNLISWKISHFPREWNHMRSDFFIPDGHLTRVVTDSISAAPGLKDEKQQVTAAFFTLLENHLETMGYVLLKPRGSSKYAAIHKYLSEWEADESDAGLL